MAATGKPLNEKKADPKKVEQMVRKPDPEPTPEPSSLSEHPELAPVRQGMNLTDLRYLLDGLESIEEQAQAFATIKAMTIEVEVEGNVIAAKHDGTEWTIEVQP